MITKGCAVVTNFCTVYVVTKNALSTTVVLFVINCTAFNYQTTFEVADIMRLWSTRYVTKLGDELLPTGYVNYCNRTRSTYIHAAMNLPDCTVNILSYVFTYSASLSILLS